MFKNVLIFGDSYSTFEGCIPEGYAVYYNPNGGDTDVRNVKETWWHQLISETKSNLILNNSWSGSTIGYTGYNNSDCSKSSSFIFRFRELLKNNFFVDNDINTIFVFGGTNDSWSGAPLGEFKASDWQESDLYNVLPAISYFMDTLKKNLPDTKIIWVINTELKPEITECMIKSAELYGITVVPLQNIDKSCGHPSVKGMEQIKNQILNSLNKGATL